MVVTRQPANVPPPPASRTNSTQALNRRSHKPHDSKQKSQSLPATLPQKSKKKHPKPRKQKSRFERAVAWIIPLILLYAIWVCPSDTALDRPVCRSLSIYSDYVLRPYVLSPIQSTLQHPAIHPYVQKAIHFEQKLEPYVTSAVATTTPYAIKTKNIVWDGAAVPAYKRYVLSQYYTHIYPHLQHLYAKVDPYITPIHQRTTALVSQTTYIIHRVYTTTEPHVHRTYAAIRPHAIRLYTASRPVAVRAYSSGKEYAYQGYDVAKPYVRLAYLRSAQRVKHYLRKLTALRKQYVDKHVGRIWEKVEELSASGGPKNVTASHTAQTMAESLDSTSSTTSQLTQHIAETTETVESTASSASPAEAVVPETVLSASSVMAESISPEVMSSKAPGFPPAVPSQPSSAESDSTSYATTCDTPSAVELPETSATSIDTTEAAQRSSAASVIVESVAPSSVSGNLPSPPPSSSFFASAASTVDSVEADEDADGLDELLRDLGLSEAEEHDEETGYDEPETPEEKTPEELERLKKEKTARDRADITARHTKWAEEIDELIKSRKKSVRKMLVRVRKGSVKSLWDKSPEPEPVDEVTTEEDVEKMRFIDGERVSLLLDNLATEGDKLLKGLEAYLRKEQKSIKSAGTDGMDERIQKWDTFLEKVEEKFSESSSAMKEKVHRWFLQVRDIEVRDCLAACNEVKGLAEDAQTDLSMDYAWLADVTYKDWQRYHDLMRAYRRFDEQVRMIQNGTHPSPPVDPIPKALDDLQADMDEVLIGWATRVRGINRKALREVFVAVEEPEVSILPIEPEQVPGGLDASDVTIGKSEAQIKEALKDIPVEHVHEEL